MAVKLLLASSNPGKLREFRALAQAASFPLELKLFPGSGDLPEFEESAPTFAENALGKALYYSRHAADLVLADDSGLVVPSLGGRPGVHSARYAGPGATNPQRIEKLLGELQGKPAQQRAAHFVCALVIAHKGRTIAIITARTDGEILTAPRGAGGFGYDPIFYFPPLDKSFAELSSDEKNKQSHRGMAFRRLLAVLPGML